MKQIDEASTQMVREYAKEVLRVAPINSVKYLRDRCFSGGIDGKRYDSCFYGTLTAGTGVSFEDCTPEEIFQAVALFCKRTINLELKYGEHTVIEKYLFHVNSRQRYHNSDELLLIMRLCDEALDERDIEPSAFKLSDYHTRRFARTA